LIAAWPTGKKKLIVHDPVFQSTFLELYRYTLEKMLSGCHSPYYFDGIMGSQVLLMGQWQKVSGFCCCEKKSVKQSFLLVLPHLPSLPSLTSTFFTGNHQNYRQHSHKIVSDNKIRGAFFKNMAATGQHRSAQMS